MNTKKFLQNVFLRMASWFEANKEEVPRKHKLKVRKIIQPHIDKRIDMGSIPDPFGSCLAVLDNMSIAIDIMSSRFKMSDDKRREVDQIQKKLNMSKRQFAIMISDIFAEETYGKELSKEEELVAIYRVFESLERSKDGWTRNKRDINLEEWALNIRQDIDSSFEDLMEIASDENIPVRPLLYEALSPDIKIKRIDMPKNPRQRPDDEDDYESGYPDDNVPF